MTDIIKKFVNTEGGLLIEIEGTCSPADVDCYMLCRDGVVDSGSFTIINACTMPITVTGFTVSDSGRFSLVEYPKYTGSGVYPSGEVPELPIPFTLKPREKKRINTFFHPYYEELMYGNAGTITSRTGDKFGATVQIYPGFPILNCPGESDCDASVILSGEFICEEKELDLDWMLNKENVDPEFDQSDIEKITLPNPSNSFFLSKKPTYTYQNPTQNSSPENYFEGIIGALEGYASYFNANNWFEQYKDFGISGSLHGMFGIVQKIIQENRDDDKVNLQNSSESFTVEVNDFTKYKTSYSSEDFESVSYENKQYVVMPFDNDAIDGISFMTNQAMFIEDAGQGNINLFLCDDGDFSVDPIREI